MKFLTLLILLLLSEAAVAKDLVIASMEGCPPCRQLNQFIKDNPDVVKNFNVIYLDCLKDREEIDKLNVTGFPTYFIFDDNKQKVAERSGFSPQSFTKWIQQYE